MNTYKTHEIILSTKGMSNFQLVAEDNKIYPSLFNRDNPHDLIDNLGNNQHLYIISDEKIEEENWVYEKNLNQETHIYEVYKRIDRLCFFRFRNVPIFLDKDSNNAKKIIASTDPSIKFPTPDSLDLYPFSYTQKKYPQTFIDYFISEYNKENKIEKVEVEYEKLASYGRVLLPCSPHNTKENSDMSIYKDYIKINPDNTINIKPLKDSWSREEVIEILKKFRKETYNGYSAEKWISKNL